MGVPLDLADFLTAATQQERQALADTAKTTVSYLWQIASDPTRASKEMRERIALASDGAVVVMVKDAEVET